MAKSHSEFICQQCGYKSASFLGRCPNCGAWGSLAETVISGDLNKGSASKKNIDVSSNLFKLIDVKSEEVIRLKTGFSEFDRVLGGGIVPGSIVLISGDPGIGKSTLLLQCAMSIAEVKGKSQREKSNSEKKKLSTLHFDSEHPVLYVTGEESAQQVKIRADRLLSDQAIGLLGKEPKSPRALPAGRQAQKPNNPLENLYIFPETDIDRIISAAERLSPKLIIVDSIQTLTTDKLTGTAGSVGQVRECSSVLQRYSKSSKTSVFLVGHVTKEGTVAGPKVLEHLVDAVLNLEGDGMHNFRLLRSLKNRFGSTFEVGVFEMIDVGMREVANPSEIFLSERLTQKPGSAVTCTVAGGRPLLAEVQALTTPAIYGVPVRRVTGLEFLRMQVVLAALSKSVKVGLGTLDVYLNVAGGLKIQEPAGDLAAALAVASTIYNKPLSPKLCVFGEVGLLGEVRRVNNIADRIKEAKRLGFREFVTPEKFKTLGEAIRYAVK